MFGCVLDGPRVLVPTTRAQHNPHHREHHRHFDQHANDGRKRRSALEAEQRDRRGNGELEELGPRISADGQATLCGTPNARLIA